MIVGLIADTHGLLRREAVDALRGSDFIVHAGDVGRADILAELACIAPVTAVRGNIDTAPWTRSLPETATLQVGAVRLHIVHDVGDLDGDPAACGVHAVVSGHSHRPGSHRRNGVLYVNPGSAGPRRFSLPICVAHLHVEGDTVVVTMVEITPAPK